MNDEFQSDVLKGLNSTPKYLHCKHFYDERGSQLFESICETPEYYVTRTEISVLEEFSDEISDLIGKQSTIIEPGAGSMKKTTILLAALDDPKRYIPTDISKEFLFTSIKPLSKTFPGLSIDPMELNFNHAQRFKEIIRAVSPVNTSLNSYGKNIVFFPGSTIGNFQPIDAKEFLLNISTSLRSNDAMLIGVDLVKNIEILEAAYNDKQGITAAFNKNLLERIKNELSVDIKINQFSHKSLFNNDENRIEMHLMSDIDQTISIDGQCINFRKGESIHTENSYKYHIEDFSKLAREAGFSPVKCWTDKDNLFSLHYLQVP
jgi:dimethylhistidine N-methyltransferase